MKETEKKVGYIRNEVKLGGGSIMEVNRRET